MTTELSNANRVVSTQRNAGELLRGERSGQGEGNVGLIAGLCRHRAVLGRE